VLTVVVLASVITGRQQHELLFRSKKRVVSDAQNANKDSPFSFFRYLFRPVCLVTSLVTGALSAALLAIAVNSGEIQGNFYYALILGFTVPFLVTIAFMTFPGRHSRNIGVLVTSAIGCSAVVVLLTRTSSVDTSLGFIGTIGIGVFFSPLLAGWIRGE